MGHTIPNKTDHVMGVLTLLVGIIFAGCLCAPVFLIVQQYRPDLDMVLTALGTGLGLASAMAMVPVGLLVMHHHPGARQGSQLVLMGWVFAGGFAMLGASLFAFRPVDGILLCGSMWPFILWVWARSLAPPSLVTPAEGTSAQSPRSRMNERDG